MSDSPQTSATVAPDPVAFTVARGALAVLPPVTLITALLFYFGWARVAREAGALGSSDTVFAYSTSDYLLRSVDSLYFPLMVLTALALLALLVHQRLKHAIRTGPPGWLRRAGTVVLIGGLLLIAYGLAYRAVGYRPGNDVLDITGPLALGVGPLLAAYGAWMRAQAVQGAALAIPGWERAVAAGLLLAILALSLFWAVGNYAGIRGLQAAQLIAAGYRTLPHVVIYSAKELSLAPDVVTTRVGGDTAAYQYRSSGLHLLDHVAGTWFLMPENWDSTHRLIMINDASDLRFELTA
jgi:hypothetical protein